MVKITRPPAAAAVVDYLAGRGRNDEHEQQRVIWGSLGQQGLLTDDQFRLQIIHDLSLPGRAYPGRVPASGEFWHCSLSLAAREGMLSDAHWTEVGRDFMRGMEVPSDARWVLVRHGLSVNKNDHAHLAASVVSESGQTWTSPDGRDWVRASQQANRLEHSYGFEVVTAREAGTGAVPLGQDEYRIAQAHGEVPARRQLEMAVRRASILSGGWDGFEAGLHQQGVGVSLRNGGRGYSVSLNGSGPWFSGSQLAKDLSLPRLHEGWSASAPVSRSRTVAIRQAVGDLRGLQDHLLSGGLSPVEVAGAAHEVAGVLAAASARHGVRPEVVAAARDCARYAGRRGPIPGAGRLRAAALAVLSAESGSDQAVLQRQLLATFGAVQAAHRLVGGSSMDGKGVVRVTTEDLEFGLTDRQAAAQARLNARPRRRWLSMGAKARELPPLWDATTFRANLVADAIARDHPDAYRQHGPVERITDEQAARIEALSRDLYRDRPAMVINRDAIDLLDRGRATQLERQLENGLGPDRVQAIAASSPEWVTLDRDGTPRPLTRDEMSGFSAAVQRGPLDPNRLDQSTPVREYEGGPDHLMPGQIPQQGWDVAARWAAKEAADLQANPERATQPGVPDSLERLQGIPDPETWAARPITPVQERTLRARGYATADLEGMPSKVASRHVTHDLNIRDAQAARGTYPAIPDGVAQAPDRVVGAPDHTPAHVHTPERVRPRTPTRARD
jgi:hypothetical protein